MQCRVCGCDDLHACIVEGGPGEDILKTCSWVEPGLCSACVERQWAWFDTGKVYKGRRKTVLTTHIMKPLRVTCLPWTGSHRNLELLGDLLHDYKLSPNEGYNGRSLMLESPSGDCFEVLRGDWIIIGPDEYVWTWPAEQFDTYFKRKM